MIKSILSISLLLVLFSTPACIKRNPQLFHEMAGEYEWTVSHSPNGDNNGNPLPNLNAESTETTYKVKIKRNGRVQMFENDKELKEPDVDFASGDFSEGSSHSAYFTLMVLKDFYYTYNVYYQNDSLTIEDWPHVYYVNTLVRTK